MRVNHVWYGIICIMLFKPSIHSQVSSMVGTFFFFWIVYGRYLPVATKIKWSHMGNINQLPNCRWNNLINQRFCPYANQWLNEWKRKHPNLTFFFKKNFCLDTPSKKKNICPYINFFKLSAIFFVMDTYTQQPPPLMIWCQQKSKNNIHSLIRVCL